MTRSMIEMLTERRNQAEAKARAIIDRAESEKRELTPAENTEFDTLAADMDSVRSHVERLRSFNDDAASMASALGNIPGAPGSTSARSEDRSGQWIRTDTGAPAALRSGQRFEDHETIQGNTERASGAEAAALDRYSGSGDMLRALATTGGGSAVVPTVWNGQMIDLARNHSAVMQAGASIVPMLAKTVNIGRLTGDPTAAFRAEASAIADSTPVFDNVQLDSKTLSARVDVSMEWLQDSDNGGALIENALAQQIAQKIDLIALYGGIVAGAGSINLPTPPNPRGVLAALNATKPANVLGAATNGTIQTAGSYWSEVLDTIYTVRDGNETPTGLIWSTKLARQYAKATDTTGQPLQLPSDVADIPRFASNQIPSGYTQGTMASRATDLFVGAWDNLLIGQRLGLTLQVATELLAATGQVAIFAHWRGDVQPARPGAFAVYKAIQGAA
ncbi:phage major capsid protein [Pseudarthrobacter sp. SSS035]|uniref:phage major capsid protein n=1 Tax=Pseudarthrobacter sp. SSS035 TaxID=2931399 RepID=UPI00200F778B|nr:phage major capsid protein [Pseudarthrobacter sp. SSS035]